MNEIACLQPKEIQNLLANLHRDCIFLNKFGKISEIKIELNQKTESKTFWLCLKKSWIILFFLITWINNNHADNYHPLWKKNSFFDEFLLLFFFFFSFPEAEPAK